MHFVGNDGPDPNPGAPGAVQSQYPPPLGTPNNWYAPDTYNFMAYGTRAGGEVFGPLW